MTIRHAGTAKLTLYDGMRDFRLVYRWTASTSTEGLPMT